MEHTFTAMLEKSPAKGGWTFVVWPRAAEVFGTKGLVKVEGTIDGVAFRGAFMALGDGRHKLAVTAAVRQRIGKAVGEGVTIAVRRRDG